MKQFSTFALSLLIASSTYASTFVGNGGNAGDVELQVAINQIQATIKIIAGNKNDPKLQLCTCYERFKEQRVCNNLSRLTEEQIKVCADTVLEKSDELLKMLNDSSSIRFTWTPENIDVVEKNGLRGVDAVTDPATRTITLNQKNFIAMAPSERTFLIAHELFHLTSLNGKPMADEGEYPGFPGSSGGRQFINAMASALVIESYDYGSFNTYARPLKRSQGIKSNWISSSLFANVNEADGTSAYDIESRTGLNVSFRHQFNEWGLIGSYSYMTGKKDILTSTKIEENRNLLGLGVSYRMFLFKEPLSFWGQSHLVLSAKIEHLSGTLKANDSFIGLEETATSTSWSVGGNYFIPFVRGLWGFASIEYSAHQLNYQQFNLKYKDNNVSLGLGVAYAF